jgi:hypothetical protein
VHRKFFLISRKRLFVNKLKGVIVSDGKTSFGGPEVGEVLHHVLKKQSTH